MRSYSFGGLTPTGKLFLRGAHQVALDDVEGETLADKLKRERLSVEQSLALAQQIAAALAEAQAQQIIHRDIKPANIMITSRPAQGRNN